MTTRTSSSAVTPDMKAWKAVEQLPASTQTGLPGVAWGGSTGPGCGSWQARAGHCTAGLGAEGVSHGQAVGKRKTRWQAEATANAVAEARSIAQSQLANTPAGRLSDQQWGWIISAAIFAWIQTRYQQAVAEGLAKEAARHPDGSIAV